MPFTPRNWTDGSAPAVSAANIEDLETRVTDYTNTIELQHAHNVKSYGAVGDDATDDTAAIQDAIDAVEQGIADSYTDVAGGIVFFPPGAYRHTGIDLNSKKGIRLVGAGGLSSESQASRLIFTGTGSGIAYDMRSANGCDLVNLGIHWSNNAFTGNLISYRHGTVGYDAARCLIDHCHISPYAGPDTSRSPRCLVDLDSAIEITIRNSALIGAQYAIHGVAMTAGGYSYSNSIRIENNEFQACTPAFITNAGESWVIRDNTFECQLKTLGGPNYVYATHNEGGASARGGDVLFEGNWVGDVSGDFLTDFYSAGGSAYERTNWTIRNNQLAGGGPPSFFGAGELVYEGNVLDGEAPLLSLGTLSVTPAHHQVVIRDNRWSITAGSASNWLEGRDNTERLHVSGNTGYVGDYVQAGGHLQFSYYTDENVAPTLTVGAAAGTGASGGRAGNDTTGEITITTGTGATTGVLWTLTYKLPYLDAERPRAFLFPANSNAGTVSLYHDWEAGAGEQVEMRISSMTDLADATIYKWWYWVVA